MIADEIKSNEQLYLKLGNWEVLLHADLPDSIISLQHFSNHFQAFISHKCANSNAVVGHLFITGSLSLEEPEPQAWWPECKSKTWRKFWETVKVAHKRFPQTLTKKPPDRSGEVESFTLLWSQFDSNGSDRIIISSMQQKTKQFIALIINSMDEFSYLKIFKCALFLANQWHIEHGALCLHSAAVARGDDGFLFLGASEAGKSTISRLSYDIGYPALGDDLNFIIGNETDYYLAASPSPIISPVGYSFRRPKLRGIFTLVQDKHNTLNPLHPMQVARTIFKEFF